MENKRGSGIFLGIIGVSTLVVAIIGATFAFFSATASSAEDAVTAASSSVTMGYEDDASGLRANLIPAVDYVAKYAAVVQTGYGSAANQQCVDDNGNEVCSTYIFTVGNPGKSTMPLTGRMIVGTNGFSNLWFAIYEVVDSSTGGPFDSTVNNATSAFSPAWNVAPLQQGLIPQTGTVEFTALSQTLAGSKAAADEGLTLDPDNPAAYHLYTEGSGASAMYNKRTYMLVLWIQETSSDQTATDANSVFSAQIEFSTGDGAGITGSILAAAAPQNP